MLHTLTLVMSSPKRGVPGHVPATTLSHVFDTGPIATCAAAEHTRVVAVAPTIGGTPEGTCVSVWREGVELLTAESKGAQCAGVLHVGALQGALDLVVGCAH